MFKLSARALLAFALVVQSTGFAADLNLPADQRPQIRSRIRNCETLLTPSGQLDDSVGIPFASNTAADFEEELRKGVEQYGREKFRDGTFYVLGVGMGSGDERKREFEKVLAEYQLDQVGAKIKVLTVPNEFVRDEAVSLARRVLERALYFPPSTERDLQSPQWGEVLTNWQATAMIESATVYFVYKSLPVGQATLVLATHAALLSAYSIYSKSMLNYLFREGGKTKAGNGVELFIKQMLLSVPFVLNFNVFGRLSDIVNAYKTMGWEKTVEAFPYEMAHFTSTQGLTLVLQTVFYSAIITRGFGGWVEGQAGDENTRDARTLRPLLQVPILAADSVALMLASSDLYHPLLNLGAFDINAGHLALVALTGSMWLFFKKFPRSFDGLLKRYQARRRRRAAELRRQDAN